MTTTQVIVLLGLLASFGVFGYRCWQRFQHMRLGRSAGPFGNWGARVWSLVAYVCGQARVFRFKDTGTAHFFIFWGFMLLVPTILQAMLEGLFPGFVLPFLASFGPLLLVQDFIAVATAVAVIYGLHYRLIVKPSRYEGSHQGEGVLVLCFILTIMVTLLGYNGIQHNLGHAHVAWQWQPISAGVGRLFAGLAPALQVSIAHAFWWIHLGVVLVFLTMLPLGKHFHVVTSIFNVLLRNLEPRGRLAPALRTEQGEGNQYVEQFTWRQMLDWYSCTECGRCQDVCPAHNSGTSLSPKKLIMGLRAHLYERGQALKSGDGQDVLQKKLTHDVITEATLWACTTCYACDQECPLFVEHVQPIVDMRRYLLTQKPEDQMLTAAMESLRRYGNSFGKSDKQRAKWTKGVDFKIPDARKQAVKTLWFTGDYVAYSPALNDVTLATARVFQQAGLDFGLLYDGERNAGNDIRRVGEEGLFELLRQKNMSVLDKAQFEEIVTTDPHTYNTLKHEYEWGDRRVRILHYTELLARLLADGQLRPQRRLNVAVTYHDPCYLGRYNEVYDAPRRILTALGCRLIEMPRNRDRAYCCGAGGGRIYMDEGHVEERPSENRVREAAALPGVQVFVVACPKDLTMYRDAVKTAGLEDRLVVKDLIELVEQAVRPDHAPQADAAAESAQAVGADA